MNNPSNSWLEGELSRQLAPVAAPDSLWRLIHEQRRPLRVRTSPWRTWSLAAAVVLMLVAGLVWRLGATRGRTSDLEALAARELSGMTAGTLRSGILSSDPEEIRRWIKAKLDVDLRFSDHAGPGNGVVRLVGARIVPFRNHSAAVVAYQVGGDPAAMAVAGGHDDYAVAFGSKSQPEKPCLLCHAHPAALMF